MSVTVHKPQSAAPSLVPQSMEQAIRLAELMSKAKLVPVHLQGAPGDCLLIVEQAMRWNASPYAVAQCTSSIKGKLMFEGKLVHAVIESSGAIEGHITYEFSGAGDDRKVTVSARRSGEAEVRAVEVTLKNARTDNGMWIKQPDQQLCYHGARVWARRWTPGPLLGIYTREEFETGEAFDGPVIPGVIVETDGISTRDAANASVPLKDKPEWLDRVDAVERALTDAPDDAGWMDALRGGLMGAQGSDEVAAIQGIPSVQTALKKAPPAVRGDIQYAVAAAFKRLEQPAAPAEGDAE